MEGVGYRQSAQFYPSPGSTAGVVSAAAALHNYPSKWDLLRFQQVYGGSSTGAKFVPIHCIVEQTAAPSGGKHGAETNIELDTYAILPSSALFSDIVRIALLKIGYSSSEAMGAKGTIQIRNWKPLTFDTITENPDVTIEEVLGDLTSLSTLRLRLCSQLKRCAMDEIKEKLLQFLLQRSQGILSSCGCPIEKALLAQMSKGEFSLAAIPAETLQSFNKWYHDQQRLTPHPPLRALNNKRKMCDIVEKKSSNNFATSTPVSDSRMDSCFSLGKMATRTTFDHEQETPRLQRWFADNQHPMREQMVEYMKELNQLDCRKLGKPLDLSNISYWFKNARASLRRVSKGVDASENVESCDDSDVKPSDFTTQLSPMSPVSTVDVPELPNRNAVYVVNPLLSENDGRETEVVRIGEDQMADPDHMVSTVESYSVKNETADHNIKQESQGCVPKSVRSPDATHQNGFSPTEVATGDEQATDLSLRNRKNSTESVATQDSLSSTEGARLGRLVIKEEGMSTGSAATPSPPGDTPPHYDHKPMMQQHLHSQQAQLQQHAMQMAAMSQALNMHYVHPAAALYHRLDAGGPVGVSSFASDSSKLNLNLSTNSSNCSLGGSSDQDRKKRSRVFIDPLSEIPKLEVWFVEDTHPSSYMIEKYTDELNRSAYRARFPRLEAKNVQLWFKNHRAKVKRARLEGSTSEALLPPDFPDARIQEAQGAMRGNPWDESSDVGPDSKVAKLDALCIASDAENSDGDRNTVSGSDTERDEDHRDGREGRMDVVMVTPATPSEAPHINQLSVAV